MFDETVITLPCIVNPGFYTDLSNFIGLTPIGNTQFQYSSPSMHEQSGGYLDNAESILLDIWSESAKIAELDKVIDRIVELSKCSLSNDDKKHGRWVLTNIAWILKTMTQEEVKAQIHYYFYRALHDKRDDPFHAFFGNGLLIWTSNIPLSNEKDNHQRLTQSIAITGCLMFSRLMETSLPNLQKKLILQGSHKAILKRGNLTWLLDHVVIPNLLGARLENNRSENIKYIPNSSNIDSDTLLPPPPCELVNLIKILAPNIRQALPLGTQREILKEVIEPLQSEGFSISDRLVIAELKHTLPGLRLKNGATKIHLDEYKKKIEDCNAQCVAHGSLFVPVIHALSNVNSELENLTKSDNINHTDGKYDEAINSAIKIINDLYSRNILNYLSKQWGDDNVTKEKLCGKGTVGMGDLPNPIHRPLPFYITDFDFTYKALRDNWTKYNKNSKSSFILCETKDWFVLLWRESETWCNDFNDWKSNVWRSLKLQSGSSSFRGLPLVIRFAAQNSADLFWVSTDGISRDFILGDENIFCNDLCSQLCNICKIKNAKQEKFYEIGIGFKPKNWRNTCS
jgi:hypothetical protein